MRNRDRQRERGRQTKRDKVRKREKERKMVLYILTRVLVLYHKDVHLSMNVLLMCNPMNDFLYVHTNSLL